MMIQVQPARKSATRVVSNGLKTVKLGNMYKTYCVGRTASFQRILMGSKLVRLLEAFNRIIVYIVSNKYIEI